jgi:hypothetical protein
MIRRSAMSRLLGFIHSASRQMQLGVTAGNDAGSLLIDMPVKARKPRCPVTSCDRTRGFPFASLSPLSATLLQGHAITEASA